MVAPYMQGFFNRIYVVLSHIHQCLILEVKLPKKPLKTKLSMQFSVTFLRNKLFLGKHVLRLIKTIYLF